MPDDTAQSDRSQEVQGAQGPYGLAALKYWEAGWRGVLPVGAASGEKWPPPRGFTGHVAPDPSRADVQAWLDGPEVARNIGLRLPPGVIGLDVDAYGAKVGGRTLAELTERYGELPPTWVSSARDDGMSGIRLYRAEPPAGRHWPGEAGPNIEIIQHGHRYAVVWPSINGEAGGTRYEWLVEYDAGGGPYQRALSQRVPHLTQITELPVAWVEGLSRDGATALKSDAPLGDLSAWWRRLPEGAWCEPVRKVIAAVDWSKGSRHETARDAARALAAYGGEGHAGVSAALGALGHGFVKAVTPDRGREAAEAEWQRMLVGAVRLAARAHPVPEAADPCELLAGAGVQFDASPDFSGASTPAGTAIEATVDPPAPPGQTMLDVLRSELLTPAQIKARPNPVPLINGLLDMNSLAWMIAEPGSYKSFVALDMAGHVAAGQPWQGRRVRQGPVLYLVAEGADGMTLRVRAWEAEHGEMVDAVHFLPRPVLVKNEPAWMALGQLAAELAPALVVLDTQARVTTGLEENSATEMGLFVHAAELLRQASGGACVLVIHHVGRAGGNARGSSAIDGAQGTELKLVKGQSVSEVEERDGVKVSASYYTAELSLDKQKDAADDALIRLRLRRVDQGTDPETGRDLSSLVVCRPSPFGQPAGHTEPEWRRDLPLHQQRIVDILAEHFKVLGASKADAKAIYAERFGPVSKSSYSTAFDRLAETEVIARISGTQRWIVASVARAAGVDTE